jgi:hypothetical protein
VAAAGLVVLIVLAVGLESDDQVDPARMRERFVTTLFGRILFIGRERPLEFALRFPSAVNGRESGGWSSTGRRGLVSRTYINGRTGRWVFQAQSFVNLSQYLDIAPVEADRIARRLIDLVAQGVEFEIDYDDHAITIRSCDDSSLIETLPLSTPR